MALELLVARQTMRLPAGAAPEVVTVHVVVAEAMGLALAQETELIAIGLTVRPKLLLEPFAVAVIVTGELAETLAAVAVNVPEVPVAGITTLPGMVSEAGALSDSVTVNPPAGAALEIVTVQEVLASALRRVVVQETLVGTGTAITETVEVRVVPFRAAVRVEV
jgi:hypothetical protein